MKKVFIGIDECKPGMQVADSIYNEFGAVVISSGTLLSPNLINRIKDLGVYRIKVYEFSDNTISPEKSEQFRAQYYENVEVIKDVLLDISTGRNIDIDKVNTVSGSIIVRINENRNIIDCINQVKDSDEYTYTHCINVSLLSMLIGKWLKMDFNSVNQLVQAGLLHDVGKSQISHDILNKPEMLTNEEYEEIKRHPVYSLRALEKVPGIDENVKKAVVMHHERNDGSGYPLGLKDDQIHPFAKILAIADIYDAMTHNRVYRGKEAPFKVFEMIEKNAFGILDIKATRVFLSNLAAYYIGERVLLNTGDIGEIIYINGRNISRPVIRVDDRFIDLSTESAINIMEML